jgi:ribosomal protein S18 acetylase RimI-like enzyme
MSGESKKQEQPEKTKQEIEKPQVEIMQYSDEYKDEVVKLIFEISENELRHRSRSGRPDLQKIKEVYQKNKGNFWVALEESKVVGTIALKDMGDNRGDLWRFYVRKDLRMMGVGQRLFATLMDFAKQNGYKEIFLSTHHDQEAANKFYLKHGFKRIESLPEDFPHSSNDEVFYELNLEE